MSKDKIEQLTEKAFLKYRDAVIHECMAALGIAGIEAAPACLCPQRVRCIDALRAELQKIKSQEGSEDV